MNKKIAIFISFFIFTAICYGEKAIKQVCLKDVCVQVEIADTDSQRQRGLMFREGLSDNQGMLFIFEKEEKHNFWMKNMQFPLDIIWIDKDNKIVDIKTNVSPCKDYCESLIPQSEAMYVLEVSAGFVEKQTIIVGDKVNF